MFHPTTRRNTTKQTTTTTAASTMQYLTHHTPRGGPQITTYTATHNQCCDHDDKPPQVCRWLIAVGKRPVPFRTRKLSPPALMVLHSGGCGRVSYRRPKTSHIRPATCPKTGTVAGLLSCLGIPLQLGAIYGCGIGNPENPGVVNRRFFPLRGSVKLSPTELSSIGLAKSSSSRAWMRG